MSRKKTGISYGHFWGGDPRDFKPDPECSTEEERAQWQADCDAWNRGETPDIGPPHVPLIKDGVEVGHITKAGYGLGIMSYFECKSCGVPMAAESPDRCEDCVGF